MSLNFFSNKNRPVHLGPYPLERLKRTDNVTFEDIPNAPSLSFSRPESPENIVNAMREYQAMLDAIRDGFINKTRSEIPESPVSRAQHLKAFGYFSDASMVGITKILPEHRLNAPVINPDIAALAEALKTRQTKTLAAGIDATMADLKESMEAPPSSIDGHIHALVFLYENPRAPHEDEAGCEWLQDACAHRGALRANETAAVLANYIRLLGFPAKAHSMSSTDVDLRRLSLSAGLTWREGHALTAPFIGARFGLAAITCDLPMACDRPLAPLSEQRFRDQSGLSSWFGEVASQNFSKRDPFLKRGFADGPHPFERLKRQALPTTYIDEENIPRVPKRSDMFARAQFGDMGPANQESTKGGYYVRKSAPSAGQRRALGAFVLLQDGEPKPVLEKPKDPTRNAANIKAASYFLGVDAVGLSRCPSWAWYSHDALGEPIVPPHDQAISLVIDQGYETMEGASGDDWISVAQSMRAYLRFSLLGGVIAQQIRNLGYNAKAHSVLDGEVLQPPLLLLSGLGEVSRIGEVVLNPFLGPRLKSGVVTTDMPFDHDQPINFGLQNFCENCNKCARECPSGAITAGPKRMFNGYEIWKSDSQKCATYRMTTKGGAMCGRCMKTCPWNLEGLFSERIFRWVAMNFPRTAKYLAKLDDLLGRGGLNDKKKWWWDLELDEDEAYRPTKHPVNRRDLQRDLDLKFEDQTMAVYPAPLAPHPWPYPFPMDREAGIRAYQEMMSVAEYKTRRAEGDESLRHIYPDYKLEDAPLMRVQVSKAEKLTEKVTKYEFRALDGGDLPEWRAGAHLDVLVSPEFLRQYSMSGSPQEKSLYQIGVLREEEGRGGSHMLHRIFDEGRKIFVSKPIHQFDLVEDAKKTFLMGAGIGITPMISFAHRLHELGADFEMRYSAKSRHEAAYLDDLSMMGWSSKIIYHFSDEGRRADLGTILSGYEKGWHVYICGPDAYMQAVLEAARRHGFPEEACHIEYFTPPERPQSAAYAFRLRLSRTGRTLNVPEDKTIAQVLQEQGFKIDVKCSDGLCGVCKCKLLKGKVDHRDYVLSARQKEDTIITCQSRALHEGDEIEIDL